MTNINNRILLVEDSPEDYEATLLAFQKARIANSVQHMPDGDSALDYLFRRGPYQDPESAPRPDLILLDLNLPGADGREVLNRIKSEPGLRSIPVIVLTTSKHGRDVEDCYRMGANSYVMKPVGLERLVDALRILADYWFKVSVMPPNSGLGSYG